MSAVTGRSDLVDIIIPVYRGFAEVEACLDSVLSSRNKALGEVVVINDCSPELEIHEYLESLSHAAKITLVTNKQNQGFIRSCNSGANINPENDFLLLNADTEVHGDWLDRIVAHARRHPRVASVSPFSNNATIASYPWGGNARDANTTIDVASLDRAMQVANPANSVTLPTAVGFCMFVSREAWRLTNGFDERYGRGYGEEVEFCLATAADGWSHLLACDVFVYHAGNISFGFESEQLKMEAQKIVDQRYPEFSASVQEWIKKDPALLARMRCDLELMSPGDGPRILHVSHRLGGGVKQHVLDLSAACRAEADCFSLMLTPWGENALSLEVVGGEGDFSVRIPESEAQDELPHLLKALGLQRIHFHHFSEQPQWVLDLPAKLALPYDITIHDFVTVCPQFHFQQRDGTFCGRPDIDGCDACIAVRPNPWGLDIADWRAAFSRLLCGAERVICPSKFTAQVIQDYYPEVEVSVWPHADVSILGFQLHRQKIRSRIKVAIVGALSLIKGYERVVALIKHAEQADLPLDFVIIGPVEKLLHDGTRAATTGPYQRKNLPEILIRERPDAFFFASQVPETFSYALTDCLATGLPIIALASGAIAERLEGVSRARLLPVDCSPADTADVLLALDPTHIASDVEISRGRELSVTPQAYAVRYLELCVPPMPISPERVLAALASAAEVEKPLALPLPPLQELLNAALDLHHAEAKSALRRHTLDTHAILVERERHLKIRASEVLHLEETIGQLKEAFSREENHLKAEIAGLQASIEDLQARHAELIEDLQARHADEWNEIADQRNAYAARIQELESSTLWRLMTPVRLTLHQIKRVLHGSANLFDLNRKAILFLRYHYSMGGWVGLRSALGRRVERRLQRRGQTSSGPAFNTPMSDALPPIPIIIQYAASPDLSIVVPSYGQHAVTASCVRAIAANPPSMPYEVIVADDAYIDAFDPIAFQIDGVRVLRNAENLGFLRNCNHAVSMARGQRVLLLNNDTKVLAGAIDALWRTFAQFEDVGAVGAKLLFPDGKLQEAGGIIWRDGSGWNWGRDEDPNLPRFNYVRDADYCSAAALMIDAEAWASVGGFDEQFVPCYYEDTDLCFALRYKGWRTLYQPAANVIHLEGVSHGTDLSDGQKAHQVRNQSVFATKWRGQLSLHASNGQDPQKECDRQVGVRILWVEACMLTPDQDSGSLRTSRLLSILCDMGCKVTFVADNLLAEEPYAQSLRDRGIEVLHAPHVRSMTHYLRERGGDYDVVTLCRHYIAIQYVELMKTAHPKTQLWFDTIDLHYLRLRRQHQLDGAAATLKLSELAYREELQVIDRSDLTLVVSDHEVSELASEAPEAKVMVISNVHEIDQSEVTPEGRHNVLFVGGFQHPPNVDAVHYYGAEIWPQFKAVCPNAKTFIIGSRMPERLRVWGESQGLTMLGFVEDLTPYYQECRLAIAPLRYGAGVKGKVNQALSYGLPVVGSPTALEGMGLEDRRDAMFAPTPESFALAMQAVYCDEVLWRHLSKHGRLSLEGRFTPDAARTALAQALSLPLGDVDRKPGP